MRRVVIAALLVGCTPSPQQVCDKLAEFRKTNADAKDTERCVSKMKAHKSENPKIYECEAKCVVKSKDIEDAVLCRQVCR